MSVNTKVLLSVLLVMSACFLLQTQMAGGQSYTTSTSLTTKTEQVTVPIYSMSTVATTTLTRTGTSTIYSLRSFTVQGVQPGHCYIRSFSHNASAGDVFQGTWTSNYILTFYILSESDYKSYKICEQPLTQPSTYLAVSGHTSYSLNWVAPQTGTVYFVFENYATSQSDDVTVTFTLYKVGALAYASALYTTVAIPSVGTTTVTLTSVSYSTLPSSMLAGANWITMSLLAVVVLATIVLVFLLMRRTRAAKPKAAKLEETKGVAGQAERITGKVFCINCGAELPSKSKFCNKCGSAQQ